MSKKLLCFLAMIVCMFNLQAQTTCVGPTNLTVKAHVPDDRNVTLNWTLASDTMRQTLSLSNPMVLTNSVGWNGGGATEVVPTVRFLPSDLAPKHGQRITAISFAPGVSTMFASYSVVIWQGGGMSPIDYSLSPGMQIYNEPVTASLVAGSVNTIPLSAPIIVDSTMELWVGIHINTMYGYPIYVTAAPDDSQHYQNLVCDNTYNNWEAFSASNGTENNFVIALEVTDNPNIVQGYKIYRNQTLITPTPIGNSTYVDTLDYNGVYQYGVTALYTNNCESAPVSASITMEDDTCFIFELPFEEDFDSHTGATSGAVNNLPQCWHNISGTASSYAGYPIIYNNTTYAASGRNSLRFYTTTASTDYGYQVAILPQVDVYTYPINTLQIEFEGRANLANNNFTIVVGVMEDYRDFNTFVPIDTFTSNSTSYSNFTAFFNQYTGNGTYIALMAPRTVASNYGYIDNILLSEIPSCPRPIDLVVSPLSSSSVSLIWTEPGSASSWEVEYGPTGFQLGTGNRVQVNNSPTTTISGLSPSGYYTFYVRSICGIGDTSVFSRKVEQVMDCGPINLFPYRQNFDAFTGTTSTTSNNLSQFCWSYINNGTSYKGCPLAYKNSTYAQSGENALYYYNYSSAPYTDQYAVSPKIDPSIPMNTLMIEFSARRTSYPFLVVVGIMDDSSNVNTFTPIDTMYISENETNTYKDFLYMFNEYTGNGHYIALNCIKPDWGFNVGYIDDIVISRIPTCIKPGPIAITNTTSHEVTIDWMENNVDEYFWEVVVVPSGDSPSSGTPQSAYSHPFTIGQLQPVTNYDVYVRSICSPEDFSQWSSVTSFTTRCDNISTLPYTMNFDNDGTATSSTAASPGPMVSCWDRITDNTAPYPYISSTQHSSGVGSLFLYSTSTYYSMAVSQPLDLSQYSTPGVYMSYKILKDNAAYGRLQVGITTNPDSLESFVLLDDIYGSDLPDMFKWYERFVLIPEPYTTPVYLVFRVPKGTTAGTYLDDIVVDEVVDCSAPRQLSLDELSPASVLIMWESAMFGADSYVFEYSVSGTSSWSNPVVVNGTSYRLSGLTPQTMYDVRVTSNCNNGNTVPATISFQTKCLSGGDAVFDMGSTEMSSLPVHNQSRYSYSQQIFDASELNGAATITSVSFEYAFSTPLTAKNNVRIYLAHTNKSNFISSTEDYIPNNNFQLVYTGALDCVQGWNTFTFNTPFQYNGVDNLLLVVDDDSYNYNSSSFTFNTHLTSPEYKTLFFYGSTNIDPANPESGNVTSARSTNRNNVIFGSVCDTTWYCVAPRAWVDSVEEDMVKLSWAPGYQEGAWAVEYKSDQEMFWTSAGQVSTTSCFVYNLNGSTNYEFRVCAVCSSSDSSDWVFLSARTPCQPVTLPYTQGFESATGSGATHSVDGCLTRLTTNTQTAYPFPTTSYSYEGNYALQFYGAASNYSCLVLPRFDNSVRMDSLLIQFEALKTSASYFIEVGIMSDPYDISTFTRIGTFSPSEISTQNNQKWEMGECMTDGYTGNGHYVAFKTQQWLTCYIYLDDIRIDYIPACKHVTDLQVDNVQTTTADVSWTPGQDEQSWKYVCGPKGTTDPMTSTWHTVNQNSVTLTNLLPNTEYDVFIAADCGESATSQFVKSSFMTTCMIVNTLPFTDNFDSYGGVSGPAFFPNCWYRNGTYSPTEYPYLYTTYYNSAPSCIYFYSNGNTYSTAVTNEFSPNVSINTLQASFYYRTSASSSNFMEVGVMEDPENLNSFVPVDTVRRSVANQFEQHVVSFANYTGTGHYIAFRGHGEGYMDDLWVEEISNCFTPGPLVATDITATGATIRWSPGSEENRWEIMIVPAGSALDGVTPQVVQSDTFYHVMGLSAGSAYDVYLRAICPNDAGHSGSVMMTFTTMCTPLSLPYFEDFDSVEGTTGITVNNLPSCWRYLNTGVYYSGCPLVYKNATYAASGLNSMQFYTYTTTSYSEQYAIMPEFDNSVTPLQNLELQFDVRAYLATAPFNLIIGVMSDPTDVLTFTPLDTFTITSTTYETYHVFFNSYTGNGKYITFMAPRFLNTSYNYGYVDNVEVKSMPSCMPIRSLDISHITSTTAGLSWIANGIETSWDIQYRVSNGMDTSWAEVPVSSTYTFTLTQLTPNTLYEVRMRSNCGENDFSVWSIVEHFRTECTPINQLPFTANFDNQPGTTSTSENNLPVCWHYLNSGTVYAGYPNVYSGSSYAASGSNSLRFYVNTSSTYGEQYAILPSVDTALYPINTLKLSFDARKYTTSYPSFNLLVGVMTDPYDESTFVTVDSVVITEETHSNFTTYFSNYQGDGTYIALKAPRIITINYNSGNVDNLNLSSAPMCLPVQGVSAANVTATGMDLSWTPLGTETEWVLKYSVDAEGGSVDSVVVNNATSYSLSNLIPSTTYIIEIQSHCADGGLSVWSVPLYVTTECLPITSLPFTEDFSGYTHTVNDYNQNNLPPCWSHVDQGTSMSYYPVVYYSSTYSQSQPYALRFYSSTASSYGDQYAILPLIDVATLPISAMQLSFGARKHNATYPFQPIIGVIEGSDINTFTVVDSVDVTSLTYSTYSVNLSSYTGPGNRIVIMIHKPTYLYVAGYIDDIVLDWIPCSVPSQLTVNNIEANSAQVSWIYGGLENSWNLQYKALSATGWTLVSNLTSPSYMLTNLQANTSYQVQVQTNCNDGESNWTPAVSFTTMGDQCEAPTNLLLVDTTNNTAVIDWSQTSGEVNEWTINYRKTSEDIWSIETTTAHPYVISNLQPGETYTALVVAHCTNGLFSDPSNTITFTTSSVGVQDYELEQTELYPNPTTGVITIRNANVRIQNVEVYDVYGKQLSRVEVNDNTVTVDVSRLASGVYFTRIATERGTLTKRIVKK